MWPSSPPQSIFKRPNLGCINLQRPICPVQATNRSTVQGCRTVSVYPLPCSPVRPARPPPVLQPAPSPLCCAVAGAVGAGGHPPSAAGSARPGALPSAAARARDDVPGISGAMSKLLRVSLQRSSLVCLGQPTASRPVALTDSEMEQGVNLRGLQLRHVDAKEQV